MTAPFSSHPPPLVWLIAIGTISMAIAIPFGRRDDWLGWLAFLWMASFAIALSAILIFGIARNVVAWCCTKPSDPDDAESGLCYDGFLYELTWDRERFCLRTTAEKPLLDIPLSDLLDVIDTDALFLENEVTVRAPGHCVVFPKSKSGRAKVIRLIRSLARCDLHVRRKIEGRRNKLLRQGAAWLPGSLMLAGVLVLLGMTMLPSTPPRLLILLVVGLPYGYAWYWVFRRFVYSVVWLFAARKLQSILSSADVHGGRTTRPT